MEIYHYVGNERKGDLMGLLMLVITAILFMALSTDGFDVMESAGRPLGPDMFDVPNLLGKPGAFLAGILSVLVGDAAHLIYTITFTWAIKLWTKVPFGKIPTRLVGILLLVVSAACLLHLNVTRGFSNAQPGGILGVYVTERLLLPRFGLVAANVLGILLALIGILLSTDFLFMHFALALRRVFLGVLKRIWYIFDRAVAGVLWLFGGQSPDDKNIIPEVTQKVLSEKKLFVLLRKLARLLLPRISRKPAVNNDGVFLEDDTNSGIDVDYGGMSPENQSRTQKEKVSAEKPPFGEIPGESEILGDRLEDNQAQTQGELFSLDEKQKYNSKIKQEETSRKTADEEEDTTDVGDYKVSLRHESAAAKSVTSKNNGPRLRRKPVNEDDLPDDYEYPEQYTGPSIELFHPAERRIIPNLREKMGKMALLLEETLHTFNLEAKVTDITRGPTVTRFELEPAPGMKVSRFLGLRDDIALALKAKGVRIEAPIPGKGRVGIEISNEERDPVVIRELLEHPVFNKPSNGLELALGKDITGEVCIAELTRMPHLLVAGATGAGKTVCIKALLASLLFHHSPDELQLMLIDPKMVELSIFNDIPHLITPVVTDPKKAAAALQWLITEMEERYRLFKDLRVRNIEVYNDSVENGEIEMEGAHGSRKSQSLSVVRKLPFIVCIIDELADLMILARNDVEEAIMRLAQLARAVGIHLIIATQRPSVDVLTGVIKANFPARISFQVSSRVDSRCILDEIGAEHLVGLGDMLFMPAGQKPFRLQGAFVSDSEMLALIAYLKRQSPPQYRDEIANYGKSKDAAAEIDQEDDPLLEDAIRVVYETKQASISMVQRRLRVGYTRAARLIDMMELKGIVGPHTGSKPREILSPPPDTNILDEDLLEEEDNEEEEQEYEDDVPPEEDEAE